jgi:hypothetical protein
MIVTIIGSSKLAEIINNNFIITTIHNRINSTDYIQEFFEIINLKIFNDEINKTDIFIIQIFNIQNDNKLEDDLIKIREILYPKKFIIISNNNIIYQQLNIPFINYSNFINTPNIYNDFIENIYTTNKEIIQIYYTDNDRIKNHSFHGLGDYLRGCIYLYNLCKKNNIDFSIDFSHHDLSKIIYCKKYSSINETKNAFYTFLNEKKDINILLKNKFIFTNDSFDSIDDDCKKFIIENCLTPRFSFYKKIINYKKNLNLVDYKYEVVHIRTGDTNLVLKKSENLQNIYNILFTINYLKTNNLLNDNMLFMTDNEDIDKILIEYNYKVSNLKKVHVGLPNNSLDDIKDTMVEFFLMTTAKKIYQFSIFSWGSGFSNIINNLYDIPLEKIIIE